MTWFTKIAGVILAGLLAGCSHMTALNDGQHETGEGLAEEALRRPRPEFYRIPSRRDNPTPDHVVVRTQQHDDLWARLREGYRLPQVDHPLVEREAEWFQAHQDYLDRAFERGQPYLHFIVERIERRGMPLEIALLPVVESAFQPTAYSRARAAGLWQFIPGTGRRFGLAQNNLYDGRRDVVASTEAALDYLSQLHEQFGGDWLLAFAAYNWGERNVERAVANNAAAGKPTDFFSLKVPKETQRYVPRLLGLAKVVKNPQQFGLTLKAMPNAPQFAMADPGHEVSLSAVAKALDMPLDAVKHLNPGYRRDLTGGGSRSVLVPIGKLDHFLANAEAAKVSPEQVAKVRAVATNEVDTSATTSKRTYRVRKGDTLGSIAKRHGLTLAQLKQANRGGLNAKRLQIGDRIAIPGKQGPAKTENTAVAVADTKSSQGGTTRRTGWPGRKKSSQGEFASTTEARHVHTVAAGDSLWLVSRRYNTSVEQITALNRLPANATLALGQKLVVAKVEDATQAPKRKTESTGTTRTKAEKSSKQTVHTVKDGDSLWVIAKHYGITVDDLCAVNSLKKSTTLALGQKLIVPKRGQQFGT